MHHLLEIRELTKHFRNQWTFRPFRALEDLNLTLKEGEVFGLIGHNGAGKTTTFKLLLGMLRPTHGDVRFLGQPSTSLWARKQIGFLPEHPYFYDYLSVHEILDFYGNLYGIPAAERAARIGHLVELLHLGPKLGAPIRSLSKGTLQRVGIAQAILHRPRLVILDEPMSGLDPAGRREMRELIGSLRAEGATVVFSSHILPDAEALCDRVGILAQGRLREVVDLAQLSSETGPSYSVRVSGLSAEALEELRRVADDGPHRNHNGWTFTAGDRNRAREALRIVHAHGGFLESFLPVTPSLEERFLHYVPAGHGTE